MMYKDPHCSHFRVCTSNSTPLTHHTLNQIKKKTVFLYAPVQPSGSVCSHYTTEPLFIPHSAISWCVEPRCHEVLVQGMQQGANTRVPPNSRSRYTNIAKSNFISRRIWSLLGALLVFHNCACLPPFQVVGFLTVQVWGILLRVKL